MHIAWLIRCIDYQKLVPYYLSDLISCTEKTREALNLLYDDFGDAYYTSTNEEELREIFRKMSSSTPSEATASPSKKLPTNRKRRLDEHVPMSQSTIDIRAIPNPLSDQEKLRSFISEFENAYFPDESGDFGLFRLFYIYFDQYWTLGDESTQFLTPEYSLIVLECQLHGARVAHSITSDVTHVICAKNSAGDQKALERVNMFKKINRERATKFHLISYDWIKASIENQRLVKELPFAL